jgi:predicted RNA-binding protein with PIN domain
MRLLIDGYNVIFSCGLAGRGRGWDALMRSRNQLISILSFRLDDGERSDATIVFDALQSTTMDAPTTQKINELTVIYAVDHEDADSLIESLIKRHPTPKLLTVVSSDHRIQKAAVRRKATAIDSELWWDQVIANHRLVVPEGRSAESIKELRLTEDEKKAWLIEFGFDPEDS